MKTLRLGIIGGGLMGREIASAIGRWFALTDVGVGCRLTAVCDLQESAREWFCQVPGVSLLTSDYAELLASPEVDAVYVAVPHHLHERIYLDVLQAGKDLLAEKPFGIDLAAARTIAAAVEKTGRFVRCSSEFPFLPGAQRVVQAVSAGKLGRILEIRSGLLHSSDLDPNKPSNWKRQSTTCGKIGVMGDLGMHALHLPLRLGWMPKQLTAQLQRGYPTRPDGRGGLVVCDTWDNALIHTEVEIGSEAVPMRLEMKRLAPGETNTWYIEVLGTEGGVRFSTRDPKAFWEFHIRNGEQSWMRVDLGHQTAFKTITGGIFETGFPDCLLQMLAAFAAEWAGTLRNRLGCVRPGEALASHRIFDAALRAHETKSWIQP